MPKTTPLPQIRIRLSPQDFERVRAIAYRKEKTETEIVREATIHYLDMMDRGEAERIEGVYAQQLRASTKEIVDTIKVGVNRICALMAKTAVAVLAANKFLARLEDTEDLMKECQGLAAKQIREDMTPDEVAAAQGMAKKIQS
jgi:predicted DNA-binding protein